MKENYAVPEIDVIKFNAEDMNESSDIPGLYYVSWDTKNSVYRIETRKKYYFVIPYC